MQKTQYWMMVGSLLLLGTPAVHAVTTDNSDVFSVSAGANYSSGKYGTSSTTDIWSVPITAETSLRIVARYSAPDGCCER